jgi:hypothetical protein
MNLYRVIDNFFDKLEDRVRGWFSHRPRIYGLAVGFGIVLFWRGVWHTTDMIMDYYTRSNANNLTTDAVGVLWWDGPLSLVLGACILLITGSFVSSFIGNEIIISGLRGEKKLTEKTETEVRTEVGAIADIRDEVREISKKLENINK